MRSTGFVVLSVLVHCLAFGAIALTPISTVSNSGEKIEVAVGEAADAPGVPDVPAVPEPSKAQAVSEPAPPQPKVEVKPEVVKAPPVKQQPVKTAKAAPAKPAKAPVAAAAPTNQDDTAPATKAAPVAAVAASEPTEAPVAETKEILMPVKETPPEGVEAATGEDEASATEAKSADVQKTGDPSPVAAAAIATTTDAKAETGGELNKGGASKEGAVSYMELKQMPGNKSPNYPMQARREQRQGSLELVYRVTKDGKVADITVAKSSGHKDLDNEAVKAIANFRFVPGQEGWAKHPVSFNLKGAVSTLPSQLRGKGSQAQVD